MIEMKQTDPLAYGVMVIEVHWIEFGSGCFPWQMGLRAFRRLQPLRNHLSIPAAQNIAFSDWS